jgi:phosphoribosyl-AMP cyclohydrolase
LRETKKPLKFLIFNDKKDKHYYLDCLEFFVIKLDFEKLGGLVPAVVQDYKTGEVLMLGFLSPESWERTLNEGEVVYFSRSRNKLWKKGETSGHVQKIKDIYVDCDDDTVLIKVEQMGGAACHKGYRSCFYRRVNDGQLIKEGEPVFNPDEVYKKK